MTTSDDADILIRTFGIGVHRASWHFTYDERAFPEALDDRLFTLQNAT